MLSETGADLREAGGGAVIVLISDGVESCGGDPEPVIADLRASGLEVVLHTVGLAVNATEARALAALAGAGGGTAADARDADAIGQAVTAALRTGSEFVLTQDPVERFPRQLSRVAGGASADAPEVLADGSYALTEHLFRSQRYFAARGRPGQTITIRGLVSALAIGRTRAGVVTYQGTPGMMIIERVDRSGTRLRGNNLIVRGDMGTWGALLARVEADGLARFRLGLPLGAVHRDMVFQIQTPR